jgi:hypothetical protein
MLRGRAAFEENSHSMETGARELGDLLREWADQVEAGTVPIRQVDAQGARAVASSDLMDQVQVLIGDRDIHPAAPIVIAGAALEVALRSAVEELDLRAFEVSRDRVAVQLPCASAWELRSVNGGGIRGCRRCGRAGAGSEGS